MSESEADRFTEDLGQSETFASRSEFYYRVGGIEALVVYAQGKGYDVTAKELNESPHVEKELSVVDYLDYLVNRERWNKKWVD